MNVTQTIRPCLTAACMNEAKGHFCMPCWKKLPWDLKAAITSASKIGTQRKKHALNAKKFLDELNAKPQESQDAATSAGD